MGRISIWFEQEMNSGALQSRPIVARATVKVTPSTRELIMAAAIAVALLLCVNLPYALAYFLPQPNRAFTGVLMNPEDSNSYLAKMQQGYEGEWLYHIPFTAEEHAPAFLGGFYVLLGQTGVPHGIVGHSDVALGSHDLRLCNVPRGLWVYQSLSC